MKSRIICFTILWAFAIITGCDQLTTSDIAPFDTSGYEVEALGPEGLSMLTKRDRSGVITERLWLHKGVPSGSWSVWDGGRLSQVSTYVAGRLTGETIIYDHRGFLKEKRMYLDGKYHGLVAVFHRGRPVSAARYKNGLLHGRSESYYESGPETGKLERTIMYKDGKKHGLMRYYNPDGQVTTEYTYENDNMVSGGIK